ncbi:MAG: thiamine phosphate synthase [Chloroflexi bacterium]|nr:thiamine phosphate synthase [Chloroflexota bacterium]
MAAFPVPCLCMVTDRHHYRGISLEEVVSLAVEGEVNLVQLREKDMASGRLLRLAHSLKKITQGKALLFVNDRVDVALACGADGVQLGEEALPVSAVRHLAGEGLIIGRSVHSVEGAVKAQAEGADFLIVGTVFLSPSHPIGRAAGVELLASVAQRVSIPFLAIGGIKEDNIHQVIEAGASGAAIISAISTSDDPRATTKALVHEMIRSWSGIKIAG